ncbi:hypothetical protein PENARI_c231G06909 [Penicillium arizonense]|uniref:Uncharacterized protein n=1 Tax=Penicillium arizonense TaxID=1835702 RepID=A0A1F5L0B2_PENAI|nr:hypothetical protein PENARI_c231G06909 [Penicillium arizonense]OGE46486.1 hypothetical protein PENARI_c231G06909 [Penicillium arizonense]
MDLLGLDEERQWATRNTRDALIGLDIEDFDNMPLEERFVFYTSYMLATGFLLITTDEGRYGEAIGLGLWESTAIFLCRSHMTRRDWLTREARVFYLSNNYFRIHGEMVPNFLQNCNDPFWDPDGGMDPKQYVQSLNILLSPQEVLESHGAEPGLLSQIVSLLELCGEQLQVVVLELQGRSHEILNRLATWRRELEALDRKLEKGILIIEHDSRSKAKTAPQIMSIPWEEVEGKQRRVHEAVQEWWSHLCNSEQLDYDHESDEDEEQDQVSCRQSLVDDSFETVSS